MKSTKIWPQLLILIATLIWGSSFFILKNTIENIPPFFVLALRFTLSAALLFTLFAKHLPSAWNKTCIQSGFLLGLFLFLAYAFQTYGLKGTTPGKNAFLTTAYVILVPFLEYLFTRRLPGVHHLAAAVICIFGIALIVLDGNLSMQTGDLLTLLGGMCFAVHIIFLNRFSKEHDIFILTAIQFLFCAVFCWFGTLLFESIPANWYHGTLLSILYLSVFCTTVALLFQSIGQKYTPSAQAAILCSLEAVFGVLFSVVLYHETISLRVFFGFLLVFIAVLFSETGHLLLGKPKKKSHMVLHMTKPKK